MKRILLGVGVGLLAAANASAGTLFSSYVAAGASQSLACLAVNVGKKDVQMVAELFEPGTFTSEPPIALSTVVPGGSTLAFQAGSATRLCRVTFKGSKKNVRAILRVSDPDGTVATATVE